MKKIVINYKTNELFKTSIKVFLKFYLLFSKQTKLNVKQMYPKERPNYVNLELVS